MCFERQSDFPQNSNNENLKLTWKEWPLEIMPRKNWNSQKIEKLTNSSKTKAREIISRWDKL